MRTTLSDVIGLARTELDAHTLGISSINELLQESGFKTVVSDIPHAFSNPFNFNNASQIERWIRENEINVLGFSYRLNPDDAVSIFRKLMYQVEDRELMDNGPLKAIYFSGLPAASDKVKMLYGDEVGVFYGDETPADTLRIMGIDPALAPESLVKIHPYDKALLDFGQTVIDSGEYHSVMPVDRSGSRNFGGKKEKLVDRINHSRANQLPPLIRAHAGPYLADRKEAVIQFADWASTLSEKGLLDILSIGTSQLSQERFGEEWDSRPNGGGVPINSPAEYAHIWKMARPMLVRTYAGTNDIGNLAKMYEKTMNISWHALSLWWFSQLDGRGPNSVLDNLKEHFDTINYIASSGKPLEANVPHHFAFRGADDISYVVSAALSARVAKQQGVSDFIQQIMLNNPKATYGVNDLAKARVTLALAKELEDENFRVHMQPRAGLDYFSHDIAKAKVQLAAVTALMDDIQPYISPELIHVVSYSEGNSLATPDVINESVQITRYALDKYRMMREKGETMDTNSAVDDRMRYLMNGARVVLSAIEENIKNPYSPEGLYSVFKAGFLPVPQLMYCKDEFPEAVRWQTKVRDGKVDIYDGNKVVDPVARMQIVKENLKSKPL